MFDQSYVFSIMFIAIITVTILIWSMIVVTKMVMISGQIILCPPLPIHWGQLGSWKLPIMKHVIILIMDLLCL